MIHIGGIDWNLSEVIPTLHDPSVNVLGLTDSETCSIQIKQGMNPDKAEATLFHELTHVVLFPESGIMHDEEGLVTRVSAALYAIFSDNDMLRDGWYEDLLDSRQEGEEIESKRVIVDHDPPAAESDESVRRRNHAEEVSSSGRAGMEGYSQSSSD